jgi:hypothetical protein
MCIHAVREEQSQLPLHSLSCLGGAGRWLGVPTCSMRGTDPTPSPFPHLFRWGGKVVRGAYMQYERARAIALSIPSPVQVGREGGERCLHAVREGQSHRPLHSLSYPRLLRAHQHGLRQGSFLNRRFTIHAIHFLCRLHKVLTVSHHSLIIRLFFCLFLK